MAPWWPGPAHLMGSPGGRAGAGSVRESRPQPPSAVGVGVRWERAARDAQAAVDARRACRGEGPPACWF